MMHEIQLSVSWTIIRVAAIFGRLGVTRVCFVINIAFVDLLPCVFTPISVHEIIETHVSLYL